MSNEVFKIMLTLWYLAKKNYISGALLVIKPSDTGKTDTVEIFKYVTNALVIPSTSESASRKQIQDKLGVKCYMLDEPYDWEKMDYFKFVMALKHVIEGNYQGARGTLFNQNTPIPKFHDSEVILFSNDKQLKKVVAAIEGTGFVERCITIRSIHDPETVRYITDFYETHSLGRNKRKLPMFKIGFDFIDPPKKEVPQEILDFIDTNFSYGHQRKTVRWMYRVMPDDVFNSIKKLLKTNMIEEYAIEKIEFDESKTIDLNEA